MEYPVPQFIEMESKIVGPLTLKQFLLISMPVVFSIIIYFIIKKLLIVIILGLALGIGGISFAFFKFEGQDLTTVFLYGISYLFSKKKYIWEKTGEEKITLQEVEKAIKKEQKIIPEKRAEESHLKKLAWEIETKRVSSEEINIDTI